MRHLAMAAPQTDGASPLTATPWPRSGNPPALPRNRRGHRDRASSGPARGQAGRLGLGCRTRQGTTREAARGLGSFARSPGWGSFARSSRPARASRAFCSARTAATLSARGAGAGRFARAAEAAPVPSSSAVAAASSAGVFATLGRSGGVTPTGIWSCASPRVAATQGLGSTVRVVSWIDSPKVFSSPPAQPASAMLSASKAAPPRRMRNGNALSGCCSGSSAPVILTPSRSSKTKRQDAANG